MILIEDTRQQIHNGNDKHKLKHDYWYEQGIPVVRQKLDVGDYMVEGVPYSVDTKANISELCLNLGRQHKRFINEIKRAKDCGIYLYVLVETNEANSLLDLVKWVNEHCKHCHYYKSATCEPHAPGTCARHNGKRKPMQGDRMARALKTIESRYPVRFLFCKPQEAGAKVLELLTMPTDE